MRGVVGALVVLATAAVGVPAASAGTYNVAACRAPGGQGSTTVELGSRRYFDFDAIPDAGSTKPPTPSPEQCPTLTGLAEWLEPAATRRFLGDGRELRLPRRLPTRASRGSTRGGTASAGWRGRPRSPDNESGALRDERQLRRRRPFGGAMPSGRRLLREPVHDRRAGLLGRLEDRPRRSRGTSFKIGIFCGGDRAVSRATRTTSGRPVRLHRSPGRRGDTSRTPTAPAITVGGRADQLGVAEAI